MKKSLAVAALLASAMMLSGCAIPIGVQIAKLSLDGISYLTTQKSLTDHGISLLAGEDCAMHRIVTQGALCQKWEDKGSVTVDLEKAPGGKAAAVAAAAPAGKPANETSAAEFETAAGSPSKTVPGKAAAKPAARAPATLESRLDRTEPEIIEISAAPADPAISAEPESAGLIRLWDAKSGPTAANTEEASLAGAGPKVTKSVESVAAASGVSQTTRVLSLWQIMQRGGISRAIARQKAVEELETRRPPAAPARPEPTKSAKIGPDQEARVSGRSRRAVRRA